jgi:hypothetical protein
MANFNSIQQFKDNFYGGTRPNRFKVTATWPDDVTTNTNINDQTTFKIFSTTFPDSSVEAITVSYRGRPVHFAGDRKYPLWNVTIYDDSESNNLWEVFHRWMEKIDGNSSHLYSGATSTNKDFSYSKHQTTFTIKQYKLNGELDSTGTTRTIILHNVFPLAVGEIELNMQESTPVSFQVQLSFDYIEFGNSTINPNL